MRFPPELVIASKNPDKVAEIEAVLAETGVETKILRGLQWPDVEETGQSLEENALLKARAVARHTGRVALADDTGLEVEALGGAPGVHTAHFAGPNATYAANVARLLEALEGVTDRRAIFRTVVAMVAPDGTEVVAEGTLAGEIAFQPRGRSGFGYDPVFEVGDRTLAEMDIAEKNRLSHRAQALRALAGRLS